MTGQNSNVVKVCALNVRHISKATANMLNSGCANARRFKINASASQVQIYNPNTAQTSTNQLDENANQSDTRAPTSRRVQRSKKGKLGSPEMKSLVKSIGKLNLDKDKHKPRNDTNTNRPAKRSKRAISDPNLRNDGMSFHAENPNESDDAVTASYSRTRELTDTRWGRRRRYRLVVSTV